MAEQRCGASQKFNLVFVCTGNTCRSPMAEFIFGRYLRQKKSYTKFTLSSAGLFANDGSPMTRQAREACTALSVATGVHKARQVTIDVVQSADAIVCMTAAHKAALLALADYRYAVSDGKKRQIISADELIGYDVPDPYGKGDDAYAAAARTINLICEPLYEVLKKIRENNARFIL